MSATAIQVAVRSARATARRICPHLVEDAEQTAALWAIVAVRRDEQVSNAVLSTIGERATYRVARLGLPLHSAAGRPIPAHMPRTRVTGDVVSSGQLLAPDALWLAEVRGRLYTLAADKAQIVDDWLADLDPRDNDDPPRRRVAACRLRGKLRADPVLRQLFDDLFDPDFAMEAMHETD